MIERIEEAGMPHVQTRCNFQLNVEDAYTIAGGRAVIFVDASVDGDEPYSFYEIEPSAEIRFTTHSMSPQSVLALCNDLFNSDRKAYMLSIRGYTWEFAEGLSPEARQNLDRAYTFLENKLTEFFQ
jgi:hydrogenase maturation protease